MRTEGVLILEFREGSLQLRVISQFEQSSMLNKWSLN